MKALEPLIFIFGAILIALISAAITHAWHTRRNRGQYNRGWNAGREFALRKVAEDLASIR